MYMKYNYLMNLNADKVYIKNLYDSKGITINLQQAEDIIKEYYQFQKFIDAVKKL